MLGAVVVAAISPLSHHNLTSNLQSMAYYDGWWYILVNSQDKNKGEIVRHGVSVTLVGPPNAGKSTLLNNLAKRDVGKAGRYRGV